MDATQSQSERARGPKPGFTLVELLVVIAVIMILAGIVLPVTMRASRISRRTSCCSNLMQIGAGMYMYQIDWYRAFPANRPYEILPAPGSRPASPTRGDDDLSPLYTRPIDPSMKKPPGYLGDIHVFNCPGTTDAAKDDPDAAPPRLTGEDIKFKRSDYTVAPKRSPYATQLSYEYLGEFNPGLQFPDINVRVAIVAHDDDGMDTTWIEASKKSDVIANVGKANHRTDGGNMLFVDRRVEWVFPADWRKRLLEGMDEWRRLTAWHLKDGDRS